MLTPERRRNREVWCQQHLRWTLQQWKSVVFTEESRFCLNMYDAGARVWRRKGERYANFCVREADRWGVGKVMVWGGTSWRHKTPLVIVDGSLTARRYIWTSLHQLLSYYNEKQPRHYFVSTGYCTATLGKTNN